jgi:hypothetical protein
LLETNKMCGIAFPNDALLTWLVEKYKVTKDQLVSEIDPNILKQ